MNYIKDIKLINEDNSYNMIVEIPKGTNKKFELEDKTFDKLNCVRKVKGKYPFEYGCFPQTHAGDNDPLDAILISNKKYKSLDIVKVQPIAVIKTIDNNEIDDKVIVIPTNETFKNLEKKYKIIFKFLKSYKGKKANTTIDEKLYDAVEAKKIIDRAIIKTNKKDVSVKICF